MKHNQHNRSLFGILLIVLICFVLLVGLSYLTFRGAQAPGGGNLIGVVEVEGVIMEAKEVVERLQKAEDDDRIKAIIVRVNSPGGAVGPVQEIYQEMKRIDQSKPIYASFEGIAASGGYYIGAAAREIYANAGTLTGSIGVIMEFMDLSELYRFAKVKGEVVKAGKYKDMGHPSRPMKDEERKILSKTMEIVHQQFIQDILANRKDKIQEKELWPLAQGQIFSGEEAKAAGLVDHLGSLWACGRYIHQQLKLQGKMQLEYIKEKKQLNWVDFLENLEETIAPLKWPFGLGGKMPFFMTKY